MPRPAAFASGVVIFFFASGIRMAFALAMPILILLMRHWPRLAWLGMLLLWLSPVAGAAAIHDIVGRLIGATAPASRDAWLGCATSWWAGFVAWATIIVVSVTTALVALLFDPPPIVDPDYVWNAVTSGGASAAGPVIWILLASWVYELELRARPPDCPEWGATG